MPKIRWNEYDLMTQDELLQLWVDVKSVPADERCDNFAPGTCCDQCNIDMIAAALKKRLSEPVSAA